MRKQRILIVDDSEMNRELLADVLGENYEIIEAEDGVQAVAMLQNMYASIDLVLLDIVMPHMDGFGVLEVMNENHWIEDIPVIMISAEREMSRVERAYELGVTDFIMRPFDTFIVRQRVLNTLFLYTKQKQLIDMVKEQIYQKEKDNQMMIDILSHIVESRNGESGMHVLRVRIITDFLLRKLKQSTNHYHITDEKIALISNASALHDIGKIGVDEKILNKPGKLTDEEYEKMKAHTMIGAMMMEGVTTHRDHPLVSTAYEICRWHHERYDGSGYPDGLKGDEIPISALVVALADVYDALTSPRVYKASIDHDTAVRMILDGACGAFSPVLCECLVENADELRRMLENNTDEPMIGRREITDYANAALNSTGNFLSERTLWLLDMENLGNQATKDNLTGLLNYANSRIQIEEKMAAHPALDYMLVLFALDDFKSVNDQYGHQFGNQILKHVADVLNKGLRMDDISSRIGEEKFLLFLESGSEKEQMIRQIFSSLTAPYLDHPISVSMGVAATADVGTNYDALFRAADQALYFAKHNGRGRYCFYDESMQGLLTRHIEEEA